MHGIMLLPCAPRPGAKWMSEWVMHGIMSAKFVSPGADMLGHNRRTVCVASWSWSDTLWWSGQLLAWVVGFRGPGSHGQAPFPTDRDYQASLITLFMKQKMSISVVRHNHDNKRVMHRGTLCSPSPLEHHITMCNMDMQKERKELKMGLVGNLGWNPNLAPCHRPVILPDIRWESLLRRAQK